MIDASGALYYPPGSPALPQGSSTRIGCNRSGASNGKLMSERQYRCLIYVGLFLGTAAYPWVAGVAVLLALLDFIEG